VGERSRKQTITLRYSTIETMASDNEKYSQISGEGYGDREVLSAKTPETEAKGECGLTSSSQELKQCGNLKESFLEGAGGQDIILEGKKATLLSDLEGTNRKVGGTAQNVSRYGLDQKEVDQEDLEVNFENVPLDRLLQIEKGLAIYEEENQTNTTISGITGSQESQQTTVHSQQAGIERPSRPMNLPSNLKHGDSAQTWEDESDTPKVCGVQVEKTYIDLSVGELLLLNNPVLGRYRVKYYFASPLRTMWTPLSEG
jgi:hypothetical protein